MIDQVRALIRTPGIVVRTWRTAKAKDAAICENDVLEALQRLDPVWEELFPAEQARILQLLVERVDVGLDGIDIRLRTDSLASLVADLRGRDLESGVQKSMTVAMRSRSLKSNTFSHV